jgi:hypothetical protein
VGKKGVVVGRMVAAITDILVAAPGDLLPEGFQPSKYDVIVGWARQNYHHGTLPSVEFETLQTVIVVFSRFVP